MRRQALHVFVIILSWVMASERTSAHEPDADIVDVPEVPVTAERPVAASSQQFIPDKEYLLQPQGRPAQVLRLIPGFIAVEHSGGAGKADQYFVRGFDADHGTDVAFFHDGMPINFRTHAHGQGYTDLNFIIPETILGLEVAKGAYYPEIGDFDVAAAINFKTREVVKEGILQLAGGMMDTQRHLLMFSPTKDKVRTLFAAEGYYTNGPFGSDNRYFRGNVLGKMTLNPTSRSELSATGTFHRARWNGSGEIPLRTVTAGLIDRFGSIDPSEGGRTIRSTGRVNYHYDTTSGGRFFANAYGQYYRFDLFTNFTFTLNDPNNGDGFQQSDRRAIYGGDLGWRQSLDLLGVPSVVSAGFQTRIAGIHVRLGPQLQRRPLGTTVDSDVLEASYAPFLKAEFQPTRWMRLAGGVRSEIFTFNLQNRCPDCPLQPAGRTSSGLVLPKVNLILGPWFKTEFFINYGEGYHSNDARSVVLPGGTPFARAKAYEVGVRSLPFGPGPEAIELIATLWAIDLQSELVFVGDEGTTEERGRTRRRGIEVGARGQIMGPLYFNGSLTYAKAEFANGDAIPLAPEITAYGAVILRYPKGLTTQLQGTYLGVRPLMEDRSFKSPSWLDVDLSTRYLIPVKLSHGRLEAFLFIQNLFDTKWEQTVFAFESRLRDEPAGVTDIHFVPGNPRTVLGGLAWYF